MSVRADTKWWSGLSDVTREEVLEATSTLGVNGEEAVDLVTQGCAIVNARLHPGGTVLAVLQKLELVSRRTKSITTKGRYFLCDRLYQASHG